MYRSFYDISFRFHQNNLTDFNYMVHAVGFGIRYKTPVGPKMFGPEADCSRRNVANRTHACNQR